MLYLISFKLLAIFKALLTWNCLKHGCGKAKGVEEDAVRIFSILAGNFRWGVHKGSTNSRKKLTVGVTFTSTAPGGDLS